MTKQKTNFQPIEGKPTYLTVAQAAKELSCSKQNIFRLIAKGILHKTYINKRNILLKYSEIESAAERADAARQAAIDKFKNTKL